jgi:hypothetical protein
MGQIQTLINKLIFAINKNYFLKKFLFKIFFVKILPPPHPPAFPPEPLKGGLCHAHPGTPRDPPPGASPPKKGVAPPRAKKREKRAILGVQYAKNGDFGAKIGHFGGIFPLF